MPDQRYTVIAPVAGGTHNQTYGWTVRDNATDASDYCAWSPCTGTERDCRRYAREMNRRVREGSL